MVYRTRHLDATFSALADPTRREILARLAGGDLAISALASRFDMSLPGVSKHVRVLQRAGLASIERHGRVRRARITAKPMRHALEWIARYRTFWESELDLLARYLEGPPSTEPPWKPESPTSKSPRSKSVAPSARRGPPSSTRGRRRTS